MTELTDEHKALGISFDGEKYTVAGYRYTALEHAVIYARKQAGDDTTAEQRAVEQREIEAKAKAIAAETAQLAKSMKVISLEIVPEGKEIVGLVRGSTARSKNAISDFGASLKNLVGGEVVAYTKLMADAREQALQRLKEDAAKQGGDTIVGLRFASSMIEAGVSEVIAWGTALKDKAD